MIAWPSNSQLISSCGRERERERGALRLRGKRGDNCVFPALDMKYPAWLCFGWGLLTAAVIPLCVGEMYTSLLNVKQAISVERKLIDYLRTYIDHELERLEDIRR